MWTNNPNWSRKQDTHNFVRSFQCVKEVLEMVVMLLQLANVWLSANYGNLLYFNWQWNNTTAATWCSLLPVSKSSLSLLICQLWHLCDLCIHPSQFDDTYLLILSFFYDILFFSIVLFSRSNYHRRLLVSCVHHYRLIVFPLLLLLLF